VSGGKVSDVKVLTVTHFLVKLHLDKSSGNLGGSTQVVWLGGNSSISGNNQALFVVDGIPG
jgi:hypothetical protein